MPGRNLDGVLYPVIFEDHDGSWTWSIESGKAYEPGHKVHARGDSAPDKRAARRLANEAMAALASAPAPRAKAQLDALASTLQGWAVVRQDSVLAIFADRSAARTYATTLKHASVRQVDCRLDWK